MIGSAIRKSVLVVGVLALSTAAYGQDAGRVQLMNRIVDGINSPDPVTRLVTLEEAMGSNDKNLQRIALSTAFASSDLALRTAAVEAAFANKSSFVIQFTGLAEGNKNQRVHWDKSGGQIEVRIQEFDKSTGDFVAFSPLSQKSRSTGYVAGQGNLAGDRLSFNVSVYELATLDWCRGAVTAAPGETVMTGSMNCDGDGYTIQVDILR